MFEIERLLVFVSWLVVGAPYCTSTHHPTKRHTNKCSQVCQSCTPEMANQNNATQPTNFILPGTVHSLSLSSNLYGHVQSYGIYTDTRTHTHIHDGLSKCLCMVWLINRNSMRAASCLVLKTVTCLNNLKHCILSFMFETAAKTCRKCYVIYTYTCICICIYNLYIITFIIIHLYILSVSLCAWNQQHPNVAHKIPNHLQPSDPSRCPLPGMPLPWRTPDVVPRPPRRGPAAGHWVDFHRENMGDLIDWFWWWKHVKTLEQYE